MHHSLSSSNFCDAHDISASQVAATELRVGDYAYKMGCNGERHDSVVNCCAKIIRRYLFWEAWDVYGIYIGSTYGSRSNRLSFEPNDRKGKAKFHCV